jgi:YVTN family beta-propeller protein
VPVRRRLPSRGVVFLYCFVIDAAGHACSAQQWIATVPANSNPYAVAVDSTTNKIYVGNQPTNSVRVIDGATLTYIDVPVLVQPSFIAVN